MKILVASDSFKGTLRSADIGRIVKEVLEPVHQVDYLSVSDGGEGFLDAWRAHFPGSERTLLSCDPLGREITCSYLLTDDGTAIIESAVVSGLNLLSENERDPLIADSYGLGLLIGDALKQGANRVFIGLGGSAVNDGGIGLLRALGIRFYDPSGNEILQTGGGMAGRIAGMDMAALEAINRQATFIAICDVDNPLLGPRGATPVYGPQKGADAIAMETLESGLTSYASVVKQISGTDYSTFPGAGAAGGLGFCLKSFLGARLLNGMEALIDLTQLHDRIGDYDLIITGEGRLDEQTESGKAPLGMLRLGQEHAVPVICLCGENRSMRNPGFREIFAVVPGFATLEEAMASPVETFTRMILLSRICMFESRFR